MKIKELREKAKKNQLDIAQLLNITQGTYGKYERGELKLDINSLIKLADYYNVSIDYLVGRQWLDDVGYLSPEQKNAVKILKQLDEMNLMKGTSYLAGLLAGQEMNR